MKQYKISNVSIVKMVALFSASMLFTPWAAAENMLDVYKTAKDNDAVLGAANASFAASKELVPQARSRLLPSIGAQTSTSKINRDHLARRTGRSWRRVQRQQLECAVAPAGVKSGQLVHLR